MPSVYFAETYLITFIIYFIKHFRMILDFKTSLPTSVKFECMFLLIVSGKVSEKSVNPIYNILSSSAYGVPAFLDLVDLCS